MHAELLGHLGDPHPFSDDGQDGVVTRNNKGSRGPPGSRSRHLGIKRAIQIVQEIEPSLLDQLRSGQVSSRRNSRSLCPLI